MNRSLWAYVALGMVLPSTAAVYALVHAGAIPREATMPWMLPIVFLALFGAVSVARARIEPGTLRVQFWAVVIGQAAGVGIGLYSAATMNEATPLWAVAIASAAMLMAWAVAASFRIRKRAADA